MNLLKLKLTGHPKLSAAKYHLGLLGETPAFEPIELSVARLHEKLIPQVGGGGRRFADDPDGTEEGWRGSEPPAPPEVAPEALKKFDAGAQEHRVFNEARQVEAAARQHFGSIAALLADFGAHFGSDGEYHFPDGVSMTRYLHFPELALQVATGFAELAIEESRTWKELDEPVRACMAEIIRRKLFGLPIDQD